MSTYNWQQPDWPHFQYDLEGIHEILLSIAQEIGVVTGKISHLSATLQTETLVDLMVEEAIKTSQIEGEHIHFDDVRSSIKNKLGLNQQKVKVHDKRAQGIAELMLDARKTFKQALSEEKLFDWHFMLMSMTTNPHLRIGSYRIDDEPMQIVSGYHGKLRVHFEAPPAKLLADEMHKFIEWFNNTAPGEKDEIIFAPVRAAIAHLYFESIHPFDDGNGRIGRVIAEKALSQGFDSPLMLSLSRTIESNKSEYYKELNTASRSNKITNWIKYFSKIILDAQIDAQEQINFILKKAKFYQIYENQFNERQMKVIDRMMKAGIKGYEGGMSAKKYMAITNVAKATATRDLQHMLEMKAVKQTGSGRSVRYELNL